MFYERKKCRIKSRVSFIWLDSPSWKLKTDKQENEIILSFYISPIPISTISCAKYLKGQTEITTVTLACRQKPSLSTTSIMDRQLFHKKVCQIISVMKKKHWCFCCLQDKTWIKMPKQFHYWESLTGFLM